VIRSGRAGGLADKRYPKELWRASSIISGKITRLGDIHAQAEGIKSGNSRFIVINTAVMLIKFGPEEVAG
jgi:hypothetical protein